MAIVTSRCGLIQPHLGHAFLVVHPQLLAQVTTVTCPGFPLEEYQALVNRIQGDNPVAKSFWGED